MVDDVNKLNEGLSKITSALGRLKDVAQGRVYVIGTKVLYEGQFGVVSYLHQGSKDPLASSVDVRLEDGTVVENVSVTSVAIELFRQ